MEYVKKGNGSRRTEITQGREESGWIEEDDIRYRKYILTVSDNVVLLNKAASHLYAPGGGSQFREIRSIIFAMTTSLS